MIIHRFSSLFVLSLMGLWLMSCKSTQKTVEQLPAEDDEWEVVVFDAQFNTYLNTVAKPQSYYSIQYLRNKNQMLVPIWNARVGQPQIYDPNIYENRIDYDPNENYGLEFEYRLYNFFKFVQYKYKQNFGIPLRL